MSDRILILSNKPARIIKEIDVPFERPRDPALRWMIRLPSKEIYLLLKKGVQND